MAPNVPRDGLVTPPPPPQGFTFYDSGTLSLPIQARAWMTDWFESDFMSLDGRAANEFRGGVCVYVYVRVCKVYQ